MKGIKKATQWADAGTKAWQEGDVKEALRCYQEAAKIAPKNASILMNLSTALKGNKRYKDALKVCRKALRLQPSVPSGNFNLGNIYREMGQLTAAANCYRAAVKLEPDHREAWNNLAVAVKDAGDASGALKCLARSLQISPGFSFALSNLLLTSHYVDDDRERLWQLARTACKQYDALGTETEFDPGMQRPPVGDRKIRVGLVSGDFKRHSCEFFIEPILKYIDKDRFEVICYSNVDKEDDTTTRLKSYGQEWKDISKIQDPDAAALVAADTIDILIDLSGHTFGNRLGIFMLRSAPIQMTYLGYPDSTSLACMNYRITDRFVDPPSSQKYHTEEMIEIDPFFLCYAPMEGLPAPGPCPSEKNGYITFGSFSSLPKITPTMIAQWSQIMKRVPDSRMILKSAAFADKEVKQRTLQLFDKECRDRVELRDKCDEYRDHMAMYADIDIALDTFPYSGTTTTFEALWMGVPVITMFGDSHASRVSTAIMKQMNMNETIAPSFMEYERKALSVAEMPAFRRRVRIDSRAMMAAAGLLNGKIFTQKFEDRLWAAAEYHFNGGATDEA